VDACIAGIEQLRRQRRKPRGVGQPLVHRPAGPVIDRRAELEALGWQVQVLEGLDHTQAMQAVHVLAVLRPWLADRLGG
jgi:hypothetical protein